MPHVRQQIRVNAVALLKGLPTTGDNVFDSPARDLREEDLPALSVFIFQEASSVKSVGSSPLMQRDPIITVRISVLEQEGWADRVDQIALELEEKIAANQSLGGAAKKVVPKTFGIQTSDALQKTLVVADLGFDAQYFVTQRNPDQAL